MSNPMQDKATKPNVKKRGTLEGYLFADYVRALIRFILSLLVEGKKGIKFETTDVEQQLCCFIFHFSVCAPPRISPPSFLSRTLQNSLKSSMCHIFCIVRKGLIRNKDVWGDGNAPTYLKDLISLSCAELRHYFWGPIA